MITRPESVLKPVIFPEESEAIQWNMVPGTFEVSEILVLSPEQMDFVKGVLVTWGTGVVMS